MGPLFFRAENTRQIQFLLVLIAASMGPLFFRAENLLERVPNLRLEDWLNGAALFQSGELVVVVVVVKQGAASMGPLFFRAENAPRPAPPGCLPRASMGPLFFRAENAKHRSAAH